MTRNEARDQIVIFMCDEQKVINDRDKQALDMAIQALEQEPCEDAISRQAVNNLQKYRYNCGDTSITCISLKSVNELPSVNPQEPKIVPIAEIKFDDDMLHEIVEEAVKNIEIEPKTGHWIEREEYDADRWKCSECGRTEQYQENFCPKCGANMVEPQESEDKGSK